MTQKQALDTIAGNINAELNRRNWDMIELARRSGIERKTIYAIVNRTSPGITLRTLCKLATALNKHPAELLGGTVSHYETLPVTMSEKARQSFAKLTREKERPQMLPPFSWRSGKREVAS